MTDVIVIAVWAVAYTVIFSWLVVMKGRFLIGGTAMLAISVIPAEYGRWMVPSEWHDYPGMMFYYFPTMAAGLLSIIVLMAGVGLAISRTFSIPDKSQ